MEYYFPDTEPDRSADFMRLFDRVHIDEPTVGVSESSPTEGHLTVSPLLRGYATTIGNSLRRVMLSTMPGAAAVRVNMMENDPPVLHEFSAVPGVSEDICEIVLNVKGIVARLYSEGAKVARIDAVGPMTVTAGNIVADSDLEIVNPGQKIATLSNGARFRMEILFDHGVGYVPAEKNKEKYGSGRVGDLFVDSLFTPVRNVSFTAGNTRIGDSMENDCLEMDITTDGSISPKQAIALSAGILKEHYGLLTALSGISGTTSMIAPSQTAKENDLLNMDVGELDLSVRSYHCLRRSAIDKVGDLVKKTVGDMKQIRNLGTVSLLEIQRKLNDLGLDFAEDPNDI